jgi:hypothetical protein
VYHLELKQRSHTTRAFNLSEELLRARFLAPLAAGQTIVYDDHEWEPQHTTMIVLEGPKLALNAIGMGRGWANARRSGTDVTERMLASARGETARPDGLDRLKERLLGHLGASAVTLDRVVAIAVEAVPGLRASESLALAELAVWELLHEGAGQLESAAEGTVVEQESWQPSLLRWEAWSGSPSPLRLAPSP